MGIFTIALGAAIYAASFGIRDFAAVGVGATFFPRLASIGFVILGAILTVQAIKAPKAVAATAPVSSEGTSSSKKNFSVLYSMGLFIVYLALMQTLGYIVCSALYIFIQTLILKPRSQKRYILYGIIAVISSLTTYLLFVRVFGVMMPTGIFS